jgi:phage protein D/phage baseplate assembly protein gpV
MSAANLTAGFEINVNGTTVAPELAQHLIEIRVDDHLRLPDSAVVRFSDPGLGQIDSHPFAIGAELEIKLGAAGATAVSTVFQGQVLTVEPEFDERGAFIAARAYDHAHKLNRSPHTQTYQDVTIGDVASKAAQRAGLSVGTIDSAGGTHAFLQQSNETDWDFLWRLASGADLEVFVREKCLHFRKAGGDAGTPVELTWGKDLLSFRPRITGVQQVREVVVRGWDPKTREPIEETVSSVELASRPGVTRASVVDGAGGGTLTIADRPVTSVAEARALATSVLSHVAQAFVEADGAAAGNPLLTAGARIRVKGVGSRYGGDYALSSTTHVYRGAAGYQTRFHITGRAERGLLELTAAAPRRDWGGGLVVAIVTNNDDPDKFGRIRVRYPSLGDDTEGWWARLAGPAAGKDRGLMMVPQVGDEVVVGFEQGDVRRPYILGSLWGGDAKPGALVNTDGSFALMSDKQVQVSAKDAIVIKGEKDLTLEIKGKHEEKADGNVAVESGQSLTLKAGSSLTIEASSSLEIKCGASSIKVSASGVTVSGPMISLG